jgi:hypothetical protein
MGRAITIIGDQLFFERKKTRIRFAASIFFRTFRRPDFRTSQQNTTFEIMLTLTTHTLEKMELLLKTAGYKVRYEKGNFKTGACLLQNSKIIVINRFSNLESKVLSIAELLRELEVDHNLLDDKQTAFLQQLKQTKLQL